MAQWDHRGFARPQRWVHRSLTGGKYPYRVAGVEMQNGAYIEELDPLWQASIVGEKWHYDVYSVRDATKQAGSRTSDYELTDSFDLPDDTEYKWSYITELGELTADAMIPKAFQWWTAAPPIIGPRSIRRAARVACAAPGAGAT